MLHKHLEDINRIVEEKRARDNEELYEKHIAMFNVTKEFMIEKGLLLYGGLAINLSLPKDKRFYGIYELPDYDFFSPQAKAHAIELAERYYSMGYKYVEVRPGIHFETYKVFVEFVPVADITDIPPKLFRQLLDISLSEKTIIMRYNPNLELNIVPLSFLRLAFHNELSRPDGHIERWSKVYKRMVIFYATYPVVFENCGVDVMIREPSERVSELTSVALNYCRMHSLPIMGTEGIKLYMKHHFKRRPFDMSLIFDTKMPPLEIISQTYEATALSIHALLSSMLEIDETLVMHTHPALNKSEFIPKHVLISHVKGGVERHICIIYNAQACYAYKVVDGVHLLTIDSMLSLMYAYLFANRDYYVDNKIKCMINILLNMQSDHIKSKKYIWKRFDLMCYGTQLTMEDVKRHRWNNRKKFEIYRPQTNHKLAS